MESSSLKTTPLTIEDWGLMDYEQALIRQEDQVEKRRTGRVGDTLVLVEHPAVVTLGRRATAADLRVSTETMNAAGICVREINRGGLATAHEPGQLVAYPIIELKKHDLRWFSRAFLQVVVDLLGYYQLQGQLKEGEPGVWVHQNKVCSFGIAVRKWISYHGLALNVNNTLQTFDVIIPCGRPLEKVTSMTRELGTDLNMNDLKEIFISLFCEAFSYSVTTSP